MSETRKPVEVQVLDGAIELLSDPKRWVRREVAINQRGRSVSPSDPTAVAWCALGSIEHVAFTLCDGDRRRALRLSRGICDLVNDQLPKTGPGYYGIEEVNDEALHGRTQVLKYFRKAINARLRAVGVGEFTK